MRVGEVAVSVTQVIIKVGRCEGGKIGFITSCCTVLQVSHECQCTVDSGGVHPLR